MENLILYKCLFGSKLYGTDSDQSDTDYKAIYLPVKRDVLLGNGNRSFSVCSKEHGKNTKDDIDVDYYSFQKFLNLLRKGEQNCLDILFSNSNKEAVCIQHDLWDELILSNKDKFISKNLKSSFGFMRSQVNRYVVRGDRMKAVEDILVALRGVSDVNLRLRDVESVFLHLADDSEFTKIINGDTGNYISVCERKCPFGNKVKDAILIYDKLYNEYGERTKKAKNVSGADLKGISHSIRIGEQIKQLLTDGEVTFPLKNKEFIKDVKYGNVNSEVYLKYIDELFIECEMLSESSPLRSDVDQDFIDDLCVYAHEISVGLR